MRRNLAGPGGCPQYTLVVVLGRTKLKTSGYGRIFLLPFWQGLGLRCAYVRHIGRRLGQCEESVVDIYLVDERLNRIMKLMDHHSRFAVKFTPERHLLVLVNVALPMDTPSPPRSTHYSRRLAQ